MKKIIENEHVSAKTAKLLKQRGFPQDKGAFYWVEYDFSLHKSQIHQWEQTKKDPNLDIRGDRVWFREGEFISVDQDNSDLGELEAKTTNFESYVAPTCPEIIYRLRFYEEIRFGFNEIVKRWWVDIPQAPKDTGVLGEAETLAEALAKAWLYLN